MKMLYLYRMQMQLRQSKLTRFILYDTPLLHNYTETFSTSLDEIYEIILQTSKGKLSKENANVRCLEAMLEYKMVSKDTVEKLIQKNKIESNTQIKALLRDY